ncbi:glycogen debranching protein GlgX [Echinimonas agarilytica]|uniref:Glycogen debranching protein GlgX n=1 Tax=Echinimonas agarilytica TaxID=1215918 RepID=A0AA41W6H1_9GAMM|nr:glycogen debranching protein GlgX [Echinimonas agarilytica]MCM2679469.1 glycogen debranching protein GlgX [Echinimonas agarilytica]
MLKSNRREDFNLTLGSSYPMGATLTETGCNFAVNAPDAEQVAICLYDEQEREIACFALIGKSGNVWHGHLEGVSEGMHYGLRAKGLYQPEQGLYFDANKLLLDPYAKSFNRPLNWDNGKYMGDSQSMIPKARIENSERFDWQGITKPNVAPSETVLYEAHVKGLTQQLEEVPEDIRGTYLGMAHPVTVAYLQDLGVTSVQLMPIHMFMPEAWLVDQNLTNYWGYNPINYFSPEPRYAKSNAYVEFKTLVRELHRAGIEVIIDVVYNHTAESGGDGPILSFRGLNNRTMYWFEHHEGQPDYENYLNHSGCGNAVNLYNMETLTLVLDSMRYWVEEMQVDGFRFDLAVTLAREPDGFQANGTFLKAVYQDPVLRNSKLIAEPWDVGLGGYQLGQFPSNWSECNDRYRDTMRSFWRGEQGYLGDFATRLMGSRDIFCGANRSPHSSVNFINYHDGFTLHDLVTYENRHNEANNENSRDGHGHNISANYGVEGETSDRAINKIRRRQQRNMLATLFLSRGIPHLLSGDELSRTQKGNNNAYCQDSDISWQDWNLTDEQRSLHKFVKRLINLRKSHAVLNRCCVQDDPFYQGNGRVTVDWLAPSGKAMAHSDWHDPAMRSVATRLQDLSSTDTEEQLMLIFNASEEPQTFQLPKQCRWQVVLDTFVEDGDKHTKLRSAQYQVQGRTVAVLAGHVIA